MRSGSRTKHLLAVRPPANGITPLRFGCLSLMVLLRSQHSCWPSVCQAVSGGGDCSTAPPPAHLDPPLPHPYPIPVLSSRSSIPLFTPLDTRLPPPNLPVGTMKPSPSFQPLLFSLPSGDNQLSLECLVFSSLPLCPEEKEGRELAFWEPRASGSL